MSIDAPRTASIDGAAGGRAVAAVSLRADRQFHDERCASSRVRVDPNLAAVLLDDGVGHCQSESCTLAHVLRGEEGIEDLRLHLHRHAGAIVS